MSPRIFTFSSTPSISKLSRTATPFSPSSAQSPHILSQHRTLKLLASSKHMLRKSTCLITGASRGIGRAIAIAFAREGARCLLVSRSASALTTTLELCNNARGSIGRNHAILPGDISTRDFWAAVDKEEALQGDAGKVDVLVNAAGVAQGSLFVRTSPSRIEEIMQTNLMGTMYASRWAAKKMLKNMPGSSPPEARRGHILNISSLLATQGGVGSVAYAASKAGALGLTRSLAAELGPKGIRVNAICPGYVESDMTDAMPEAAKEQALSKIPAGRFGTVDEVADAAVFLCGNQYANNCVLNLDGGLSAVG